MVTEFAFFHYDSSKRGNYLMGLPTKRQRGKYFQSFIFESLLFLMCILMVLVVSLLYGCGEVAISSGWSLVKVHHFVTGQDLLEKSQ